MWWNAKKLKTKIVRSKICKKIFTCSIPPLCLISVPGLKQSNSDKLSTVLADTSTHLHIDIDWLSNRTSRDTFLKWRAWMGHSGGKGGSGEASISRCGWSRPLGQPWGGKHHSSTEKKIEQPVAQISVSLNLPEGLLWFLGFLGVLGFAGERVA